MRRYLLESQRKPESTEKSTDSGRLSKDVVTVIRDQRARDHFKQVGSLVKKSQIQIEKKK